MLCAALTSNLRSLPSLRYGRHRFVIARLGAGHLAYFEGADEFLVATEAFLSGERR